MFRPRLTDHFDIHEAQSSMAFAIPYLDEDIPLYIDPFMLWKSPAMFDNGLHQMIVGAFNGLGKEFLSGDSEKAIQTLVRISECDEIGLGQSSTRKGKRIGVAKAAEVLELFNRIGRYNSHGFRHLEEIQLFVDGIGKDRISDISASFLKSYLIDFTQAQARLLGMSLTEVRFDDVYEVKTGDLISVNTLGVVNPETGVPVLLVPKHWLRFVPWINFEEYFKDHCPQDDIAHQGERLEKVEVLLHNRENFGLIDHFVNEKERTADDCDSDPLFEQISIRSARTRLSRIKKLPTGKQDGADLIYEREVGVLLPTLFYPDLDFAKLQARTDDGVSIRDLIFYNNRTHPFLKELMNDYGSRQLTFEMKNVKQVAREHIDQINRYLTDSLGGFGVLVTRHPLQKKVMKRTINLWAGQRRAVVTLTDTDLEMMVNLYESKQRKPLDVLKKKYVEYRRECP